MKPRFAPRVTRDLVEIDEYLRARSPFAAERVRTAIVESLQTVVLFPPSGRAQTLADVRKLVVRKYPYRIDDTFDDATDEVRVLAIQHVSRGRDCGEA